MVELSGAGEDAKDYAAGGPRGRLAADEVWLRGNVRPVLVIGAVVVGGLALATGVAATAGAPPAGLRALGMATAGAALAVALLGRIAAGPRIGRRGDHLLVRLSPWRTDLVPLTTVECVFPGSQPLDGPVLRHVHADPEAAAPVVARRVGTLVIRFAERAREWRERPTFPPWGTWHDGHVIVDGRWCEPLSAERAQAISRRLLEAKREAVDAGAVR